MEPVITSLKPSEIFVFGSNTGGIHGRGAALQAKKKFGAVQGVGEGARGQSYAFPTLFWKGGVLTQRVQVDLEISRNLLYEACLANPEKRFLLTKVGCGLAGYPESRMRALFTHPPDNLILPEDWR